MDLERGREAHTLLGFPCNQPPDPPNTKRSILKLAPPRSCYRCILSLVDAGPQDPYGPAPLEGALRTIVKVLRGYPDGFVRAAKIGRIALCDMIDYSTEPDIERLAGLSDLDDHRMLLKLRTGQV